MQQRGAGAAAAVLNAAAPMLKPCLNPSADAIAVLGGWRIIPRPLLETVLNNHALHPRVMRPLILHGPRGTGKTTLLLHRLLPSWSASPHITAYVDFASDSEQNKPWAAFSNPPDLSDLRLRLESSLEALVAHAVSLGAIGSRDVLKVMSKWHSLRASLRRIIAPTWRSKDSDAVPALWSKAVLGALSENVDYEEELTRECSMEELSYKRETAAAVRVAKKVISMQQEWRKEAVRRLKQKGGFSWSLANSATDWPCLLIELLSEASAQDFFQPKLVLNNIEVLRNAMSHDDSTVPAAVYHDSLIWRMITLGANAKSLPIIFVTSDSYYSYQAFMDFGHHEIFYSRETFGWTPQEAKLHMLSDFFNDQEWKVAEGVLGSNPRQLHELYLLSESASCAEIYHDGSDSSFEDIVDIYLAYLQPEIQGAINEICMNMRYFIASPKVTVIDPAMELALTKLEKFSRDVHEGKIPERQLLFGAPWRHPPRDATASLKWSKIQLMDFVQSFVNTEFGINYFAEHSLEILEDPAATAMVEVGLLYLQRDPSFMRPATRGIQRCLARWLVREKLSLSFRELLAYHWQRLFRGRSYRHLMKELGYK